jgi:hypothetical protein
MSLKLGLSALKNDCDVREGRAGCTHERGSKKMLKETE